LFFYLLQNVFLVNMVKDTQGSAQQYPNYTLGEIKILVSKWSWQHCQFDRHKILNSIMGCFAHITTKSYFYGVMFLLCFSRISILELRYSCASLSFANLVDDKKKQKTKWIWAFL